MATKEEKRRIYLERKERGYCPRCGVKLTEDIKTTFCEDCKKYFSKYNAEHAETINKRRRNAFDQRKNLKKCTRCGKKLAKGYRKTLCVKCLGKQYEYNNKKERPEKNNNNNFEEKRKLNVKRSIKKEREIIKKQYKRKK